MTSSFVLFGIIFLASSLIRCNGYNFDINRLKTAIRRDLLADYDAVIGPVKYGRGHFQEIQFKMVITNLVEVNTKEQFFKIDAWILQKWTDEFLSWNSTKYKGMSWTVFDRNEIWVPDVALLNNADRNEKLAGGPSKFMTTIIAHNSGLMSWLAPASFTSTCQQNVKTWPMDTQECTLQFGSCTYNEKNLRVVPINDTYVKGSTFNGEWTIDDIKISHTFTDHHECCGNKKFSTINYKITLARKPVYFIFYLAPPAVILSFLAMMSFFIPTESGERIGFITTILLALMVFLLMIPEYLPKTSDQLPVLGVLLIFAMVIISTVLVATIVIIMFYFKEGKPSLIIQKLFFPFKFIPKKKKGNAKKAVKGEVNKAIQEKEGGTDKDVVAEEEALQTQDDEDEVNWQRISIKLNWILFVFITAFSTAVILYILMIN